jgi:hypothetical protein
MAKSGPFQIAPAKIKKFFPGFISKNLAFIAGKP